MNFFKSILLPAFMIFGTVSIFAQNYDTKQYDGYFRLKSEFRGDGECLEGNQKSSNVHQGGAFMSPTSNVTGQMWKIEYVGKGYYRLKTKFRGDGECLESSQGNSVTQGGSAFMDKCQNVSGQLWRLERAKKGNRRLLSQFRGDGECLESNQSSSSVHGGASFMSPRANVSGQLWNIEYIEGTRTYKVGDEVQGGIVVKTNEAGDHGWVMAKEDLAEKMLFADAKEACKKLEIDGYRGWRVPSKGQLIHMYEAMHKNGKGNFHASDFHWSSKTDGVNNFFKRFHNGEQGMYTNNGHYGGWIRPVRKF